MVPFLFAVVVAAQSWVVLNAQSGAVIAESNADVRRSPGSAMKPLTAMAMLDAGLGELRVPCRRRLRVGDRAFDCSHPLFGTVDMPSAIAFSCNGFFAEGARRMPPGVWEGAVRRLGLAPKTASTEVGRQLAAVGESGLECSPRQLAGAYRRLSSARGNELVRRGLESAVRVGTAQRAQTAGLPVAGKTGTSGGHGWFAGWAPVANPRVVVVVLVEPGSGPFEAAAAARLLFEKYAR